MFRRKTYATDNPLDCLNVKLLRTIYSAACILGVDTFPLSPPLFYLPGRFVYAPGGQPGSSETAVIQAEYAAVDAREKAKAEAEASRRLRGPVRVRLAPPTSALRMPSEG